MNTKELEYLKALLEEMKQYNGIRYHQSFTNTQAENLKLWINKQNRLLKYYTDFLIEKEIIPIQYSLQKGVWLEYGKGFFNSIIPHYYNYNKHSTLKLYALTPYVASFRNCDPYYISYNGKMNLFRGTPTLQYKGEMESYGGYPTLTDRKNKVQTIITQLPCPQAELEAIFKTTILKTEVIIGYYCDERDQRREAFAKQLQSLRKRISTKSQCDFYHESQRGNEYQAIKIYSKK